MLRGIRNTGNSCYAASLFQCLYTLFKDHPDISEYLHKYEDTLSGQMEDVHEYYLDLISRLPTSITKYLTLQYEDNTCMSYIPIDTHMENKDGSLIKAPHYPCIYMLPTMKMLDQVDTLEIDTIDGVTHRYSLCAFICYHEDRAHYTAYVHRGYRWYKCDDSLIEAVSTPGKLPIYMLFYTSIK